MCDTIVALPSATRVGATIFAKNSDREPNEAQLLEYVPRMEHEEDQVQCTYVKVKQVKQTYAVLLSRPYWMWGAEMGVNEFGVAIGNEAVFTKLPKRKVGLTGMDMLRIALERSTNAGEALSWIINLLEEYGQGGNCSATGKLYYHNSFIIADPHEAWVLETVGKFWVAEKVKDVRSISNALSIEKSWQMASEGVVEYAVEHGWCRDENDFSFAKCYSDRFYTTMAKGRYRQRFTQNALERRRGEIDFPTAAGIMRSHSFQEGYSPAKGSMKDVCMHAGGLTRPSQTAGSIIAILYEQCPVIWVTGTSSPCISLYKPFFFEAGLPDLGPKPSGRYDTESYWWRHEKLHRSLLYSYPSYVASIGSEINVIEADLVKRAEQLRLNYLDGKVSINELASLTRQAFEIGASIDEKWTSSIKPGKGLNPAYATYWFKVNRAAGL